MAEQSRTAQGYAQQYGVQDSMRQQQQSAQAQVQQRLAQESVRKAAVANDERTRPAQAESVRSASNSAPVASGPSRSEASPQSQSARPLTFILSSATFDPINGKNGSCFALKTIPGPPRWGLPSTGVGEADRLVKAYYPQFLAKWDSRVKLSGTREVYVAWNDVGNEDLPQSSYDRKRADGMVEVTLN